MDYPLPNKPIVELTKSERAIWARFIRYTIQKHKGEAFEEKVSRAYAEWEKARRLQWEMMESVFHAIFPQSYPTLGDTYFPDDEDAVHTDI